MDAKTIIDSVIAQSGTDASRATVLSILNERYLSQVVTAQWLLETVTVGVTVAGTSVYSVGSSPEIVEVLGLRVGTYPWDRIGLQEMWDLTTGTATWTGRAGVFAPDYDSTGALRVTLYPTPTVAGVAITVIAPVVPTVLADATGAGNTPVTPSDSHGSLIDGSTSTILTRIDERPDMAGPFEQSYVAATEKLRRRKNSLVRGRGPFQIGVAGIHWKSS